MKKALLFALAAMLIAPAVFANGRSDDAATVVEMNWNLASAGPKTIDPGLNGASDGGDVGNQLFEGLVREQNGVVKPGMAESWDISADGKTITFNIRKGTKWSDGSPFTARDFEYSWKRAMDPATATE